MFQFMMANSNINTGYPVRMDNDTVQAVSVQPGCEQPHSHLHLHPVKTELPALDMCQTAANDMNTGSIYSKLHYRKPKQHVPDNHKDEHYWVKRKKNNEAARKSRQMRKIIDMDIKHQLTIIQNENILLKNELLVLKRKFNLSTDRIYIGIDQDGGLKSNPISLHASDIIHEMDSNNAFTAFSVPKHTFLEQNRQSHIMDSQLNTQAFDKPFRHSKHDHESTAIHNPPLSRQRNVMRIGISEAASQQEDALVRQGSGENSWETCSSNSSFSSPDIAGSSKQHYFRFDSKDQHLDTGKFDFAKRNQQHVFGEDIKSLLMSPISEDGHLNKLHSQMIANANITAVGENSSLHVSTLKQPSLPYPCIRRNESILGKRAVEEMSCIIQTTHINSPNDGPSRSASCASCASVTEIPEHSPKTSPRASTDIFGRGGKEEEFISHNIDNLAKERVLAYLESQRGDDNVF